MSRICIDFDDTIFDKKKGRITFSKCTIEAEEVEAVVKVLTGQNNKDGNVWLCAGKETEAFEQEFCNYIGANYCIFTNSCTSALKMAYKWARDKVDYLFYPSNTFCATYSSGIEAGVEMNEYQPNIGHLIDGKNKVNVHYGGVLDNSPCLIEDSAHRIEANDPLIGKIRCYSFYVTKNMTTGGSGGMFVTNEKEIYEKARLYWRDGLSTSTHDRMSGKSWDYKVKAYAGGYDGNDISASIGREQLKKLPMFTKKRNEIRDKYNEAFGQDWAGNHLYEYFVNNKKEVIELIDYLQKAGIGCGYHYPPVRDEWLGVSIPIYPLLKVKEQDYVIRTILAYRD